MLVQNCTKIYLLNKKNISSDALTVIDYDLYVVYLVKIIILNYYVYFVAVVCMAQGSPSIFNELIESQGLGIQKSIIIIYCIKSWHKPLMLNVT